MIDALPPRAPSPVEAFAAASGGTLLHRLRALALRRRVRWQWVLDALMLPGACRY